MNFLDTDRDGSVSLLEFTNVVLSCLELKQVIKRSNNDLSYALSMFDVNNLKFDMDHTENSTRSNSPKRKTELESENFSIQSESILNMEYPPEDSLKFLENKNLIGPEDEDYFHDENNVDGWLVPDYELGQAKNSQKLNQSNPGASSDTKKSVTKNESKSSLVSYGLAPVKSVSNLMSSLARNVSNAVSMTFRTSKSSSSIHHLTENYPSPDKIDTDFYFDNTREFPDQEVKIDLESKLVDSKSKSRVTFKNVDEYEDSSEYEHEEEEDEVVENQVEKERILERKTQLTKKIMTGSKTFTTMSDANYINLPSSQNMTEIAAGPKINPDHLADCILIALANYTRDRQDENTLCKSDPDMIEKVQNYFYKKKSKKQLGKKVKNLQKSSTTDHVSSSIPQVDSFLSYTFDKFGKNKSLTHDTSIHSANPNLRDRRMDLGSVAGTSSTICDGISPGVFPKAGPQAGDETWQHPSPSRTREEFQQKMGRSNTSKSILEELSEFKNTPYSQNVKNGHLVYSPLHDFENSKDFHVNDVYKLKQEINSVNQDIEQVKLKVLGYSIIETSESEHEEDVMVLDSDPEETKEIGDPGFLDHIEQPSMVKLPTFNTFGTRDDFSLYFKRMEEEEKLREAAERNSVASDCE